MAVNAEALADAVNERLGELGMSQQRAADLSRQLHQAKLSEEGRTVEYPGIGTRRWSQIATGKADGELRPESYWVIDATLDWPLGTAYAIHHGRPTPDEVPPSEDEMEQMRTAMREMQQEISELHRLVDGLVEMVPVLVRGRKRRGDNGG